jgi:hypothetical protein
VRGRGALQGELFSFRGSCLPEDHRDLRAVVFRSPFHPIACRTKDAVISVETTVEQVVSNPEGLLEENHVHAAWSITVLLALQDDRWRIKCFMLGYVAIRLRCPSTRLCMYELASAFTLRWATSNYIW